MSFLFECYGFTWGWLLFQLLNHQFRLRNSPQSRRIPRHTIHIVTRCVFHREIPELVRAPVVPNAMMPISRGKTWPMRQVSQSETDLIAAQVCPSRAHFIRLIVWSRRNWCYKLLLGFYFRTRHDGGIGNGKLLVTVLYFTGHASFRFHSKFHWQSVIKEITVGRNNNVETWPAAARPKFGPEVNQPYHDFDL